MMIIIVIIIIVMTINRGTVVVQAFFLVGLSGYDVWVPGRGSEKGGGMVTRLIGC